MILMDFGPFLGKIRGYLENIKIKEVHNITIRIKKDVCNICSKKFGGYHEAIIQIRANNRNLDNEEIIKIRCNRIIY